MGRRQQSVGDDIREVLWRRRPAGVLALCEDRKTPRRDAGATVWRPPPVAGLTSGTQKR